MMLLHMYQLGRKIDRGFADAFNWVLRLREKNVHKNNSAFFKTNVVTAVILQVECFSRNALVWGISKRTVFQFL